MCFVSADTNSSVQAQMRVLIIKTRKHRAGGAWLVTQPKSINADFVGPATVAWGLNLLYETGFPEADPEFKACVS
jgi:hypothetical protein